MGAVVEAGVSILTPPPCPHSTSPTPSQLTPQTQRDTPATLSTQSTLSSLTPELKSFSYQIKVSDCDKTEAFPVLSLCFVCNFLLDIFFLPDDGRWSIERINVRSLQASNNWMQTKLNFCIQMKSILYI